MRKAFCRSPLLLTRGQAAQALLERRQGNTSPLWVLHVAWEDRSALSISYFHTTADKARSQYSAALDNIALTAGT